MQLTGLRVLLVEDEVLVALMTEDYLTEFGCIVTDTASRLASGVNKARTAAVDVAVLDINLAGEMSYPAASALLERGIPVVFTTGYGRAGMPRDLQSCPVVTKPFTFRQLETAIQQVVRR